MSADDIQQLQAIFPDRAASAPTLNNSNNTKLAQHLNNVRPSFERYANIRCEANVIHLYSN